MSKFGLSGDFSFASTFGFASQFSVAGKLGVARGLGLARFEVRFSLNQPEAVFLPDRRLASLAVCSLSVAALQMAGLWVDGPRILSISGSISWSSPWPEMIGLRQRKITLQSAPLAGNRLLSRPELARLWRPEIGLLLSELVPTWHLVGPEVNRVRHGKIVSFLELMARGFIGQIATRRRLCRPELIGLGHGEVALSFGP